MNLT
jgi:hypothetical protein